MYEANGIGRRGFAKSAFPVAIFGTLFTHLTADAQRQENQRQEKKRQEKNGDGMITLTPYLLFDGNCRQAMEFYKTCFGGELSVVAVKDSPAKDLMPPAQHGKTINARLQSGKLTISASDWLMPDRTPVRGNTVCLYLSGAGFPELKAAFEGLSQGADVTDPLTEKFFGTYGALNDKFGVRWMFQSDKKA
jgi:PhnB protein